MGPGDSMKFEEYCLFHDFVEYKCGGFNAMVREVFDNDDKLKNYVIQFRRFQKFQTVVDGIGCENQYSSFSKTVDPLDLQLLELKRGCMNDNDEAGKAIAEEEIGK